MTWRDRAPCAPRPAPTVGSSIGSSLQGGVLRDTCACWGMHGAWALRSAHPVGVLRHGVHVVPRSCCGMLAVSCAALSSLLPVRAVACGHCFLLARSQLAIQCQTRGRAQHDPSPDAAHDLCPGLWYHVSRAFGERMPYRTAVHHYMVSYVIYAMRWIIASSRRRPRALTRVTALDRACSE